MQAWHFEVARDDLSRTRIERLDLPEPDALAHGEVLVEIERFSLTANNITYAVVGDRFGYWRFFPTAEGWGRIPVWGFARVLASRAEGVARGIRLYGYWPMSSHLVTRLAPSGRGYADVSDHRASLPGAYNRYEEAPVTPHDDQLALLRPLFTTSFLLDDALAELGPDLTVIVSSASSRTAIGLAWLLARRHALSIGVTSTTNAAFVERTGLYGHVVRYDQLDRIAPTGAAAYVDMAGNAGVRHDVHAQLGATLTHSLVVGSTHHDVRGASRGPTPGPTPTLFFAPDRLAKRREDWGGRVLNERIDAALTGFIDESPWLVIIHHDGFSGLAEAFGQALRGESDPTHGVIVRPKAV